MFGRAVGPVKLNSPHRNLSPTYRPARELFSQRHPALFRIITAPLWMVMGTEGNPVTSTSGTITISNGKTAAPSAPEQKIVISDQSAPAAPAASRLTEKVTPLPYADPAKVEEIGEQIKTFDSPNLILPKKPAGKSLKAIGKAALFYALPAAIGAALPFFSVFFSIGALFPFVLGKSVAAIIGTLTGSNVLAGTLLGGIVHICTRLRARNAERKAEKADRDSAEQAIRTAYDKSLPALAEALIPYTRPQETATGKKIMGLFNNIDRETLTNAIDAAKAVKEQTKAGKPLRTRATTLEKTVDDGALPLESGDLSPVSIVDISGYNYTGTLSYYKKIDVIGSGGMGDVLLVENVTGAKFALKVSTLAKNAEETEESKKMVRGSLQRSWLEFLLGKKLRHPNICPTVDTNIDVLFKDITNPEKFEHTFEFAQLRAAGDIFIVTDFIPNKPGSSEKAPNLEDIARAGLIPKRAIELFTPVIEALNYAHQNGVYHRDIKPKNIVITKDEKGKEKLVIIDFGIAKDAAEKTQTQTGHVVGSPYYIPPYSYTSGAKADKSLNSVVDIYELGITLLECLTRENPLRQLEQNEFYHKYLVGPADQKYQDIIQKALAEIPHDGLRAIIAKMVSPDPMLNYQSMAEVLYEVNSLSLSNGHGNKVPASGTLATTDLPAPKQPADPLDDTMAAAPKDPSKDPAPRIRPKEAKSFDINDRKSVLTYMNQTQLYLMLESEHIGKKKLREIAQHLTEIFGRFPADSDIQKLYSVSFSKINELFTFGGKE